MKRYRLYLIVEKVFRNRSFVHSPFFESLFYHKINHNLRILNSCANARNRSYRPISMHCEHPVKTTDDIYQQQQQQLIWQQQQQLKCCL